MEELSHARQVLEGAALAPGNQATLDALQDPERRPAQPHEPLPEKLAQFIPSMTIEHLRPLLDDPRAFFLPNWREVGTSIALLCPCQMAACGASWQVM